MIIVKNEKYDGTIEEVVVLDREDGSQISMLKSYYDEQQANAEKGTISNE